MHGIFPVESVSRQIPRGIVQSLCWLRMAMLDGIEFFSGRENLGSLDKIRIDHDFITWRNKHHLRACNFQDIATLELLGASTLQQIRVDFHSIPAIDPHMPATSIGVVCI